MLKKFHFLLALKSILLVFVTVLIGACGGSGTSTTNTTPTLTLNLTDASGTSVTTMTIGNRYFVKATVSGAGVAASGVIVTLAAGSGATLTPTTGTALTDSSGVTNAVAVTPTTVGAAALTGTATVQVTTTKAATSTSPATTTTTSATLTNSLNYLVIAGSGGGGGGGGTTSPIPTLTLNLQNTAGSTVNTMVVGGRYRLIATASDKTGLASNEIVTFTAPASSATLVPAVGTALTNGSGQANIVIVPAAAGASTVSATATLASGATVTAKLNYAVITTTKSLSPMVMGVGSSSLVSAGSTSLTVTTLVDQAVTSGVPVTYTASCGQIVSTNPVSSDTNGSASVTYQASNVDGSLCSGAVTLQATAEGATSFGTLNVAPPVVTITSFTAGSANIASAGNTSLTVSVRVNNAVPFPAKTVALSVNCGAITPSNNVTTNGNGDATATYSAISTDGALCQGNSVVTATTSGVTATTTIAVAAPTTGVLTYVNNLSSTQIYLKDSGALAQGVMTFYLTSSGIAQGNQDIDFTLLANPGGVAIGTVTNTTTSFSSKTDANGYVTLPIFAGGVPGSPSVKATWRTNTNVTAISNSFAIGSGPVQQKSLSLSVTKHNIDGWNFDGDTTQITARVADANGNPVPEGTVVYFTSSGGQINRSCSTTTTIGLNSTSFSGCSVTLSSQDYRPLNGRVAVLAYVEGIKNYSDVNGNGVYDTGTDILADQGDAYRDDNENGQYDLGEFVIARGGILPCPGVGGTSPARANACTGLLPTTVRGQVIILFSPTAKEPIYTRITNTPFSSPDAAPFKFYLNGNGTAGNLLPLPINTSVAVKVMSPTTGCTAADLYPAQVPNTAPTTDPSNNIGKLNPFVVTLTGTPAVVDATTGTITTPAILCSGAVLQIDTYSPVSGNSWRLSNIMVP